MNRPGNQQASVSLRAALRITLILLLGASTVRAHELWIEAKPSAQVDQQQQIQVCWGHAGQKETGARLAGQKNKLDAQLLSPTGRSTLVLQQGPDGFGAEVTPTTAGHHIWGADLQVGILHRDMHSIPANTRMIMYGTAVTCVGNSQNRSVTPIGYDLEIVPVTPPCNLRSGDLVTVKVLHKGQPIGGRNVQVTLSTAGAHPPADDPRIQTPAWSIEALADPRTGEATFPLIVGGQHLFLVRFVDQTPGTYQGDRNDSSDFSHLQPGDQYEQTMYVATLTCQVNTGDTP